MLREGMAAEHHSLTLHKVITRPFLRLKICSSFRRSRKRPEKRLWLRKLQYTCILEHLRTPSGMRDVALEGLQLALHVLLAGRVTCRAEAAGTLSAHTANTLQSLLWSHISRDRRDVI